jgi:hypothetical protein
MQRRDFDEMVELDIKPNAQSMAENLHEGIARALEEGMNDAVAENFDPHLMDEDDLRNLLLPALKSEAYWCLSRMAREAACGWAEVVERNLS